VVHCRAKARELSMSASAWAAEKEAEKEAERVVVSAMRSKVR